ncbi:hypothetical protein ACHAXR_011183 [Thalassiosira sp. AJA248-18]
MSGVDDGPGLHQLAAIHFWLFDFHQLEAYRQEVNAIDSDDPECSFSQFDDLQVLVKIMEITEEICDGKISSPTQRPSITCASQAWAAVHGLIRESGLAVEEFDDDDARFGTRECQYKMLCALLCHALSDRCERQRDYVGRIMAIGRPDVQQEIMKILQENTQCSSDVEDNNETGDYSAFMEASVLNVSGSFEYESDNENPSVDMKRNRSDAFGGDSLGSDSLPQGKKRHHAEEEDDSFEEKVGEQSTTQCNSAKEDNLRATVTKLELELKESRQQEMDLTLKVDEEQSQHRAEMLQVESKYLKMIRDLEDKSTNEISEQKRELDTLRHCEQSAKELKEENSRLRDDLDVLECSKEKLSYTEEQLRKCREKIELIGDANDALKREEAAHAASVDKCLTLETELAQLKPLKRQLEEYRVRATDAEVALAECRDDLRRVKEKSSGLEGANKALARGAHLQQTEAGNLQKRLQEEGGKSGKEGTAVGIGMSELNPDLVEELKTLRSEYARLKEFESKREVDSVQRLEESYDDAKRLSERFKEQFFQTKSELEDTQQLLCESEAREAKLKEEVDDWSRKYKELGDEMKEERVIRHKAMIDSERHFQSQKKSLIDKGRQDLHDLEQRLTQKIEAERKQHKEKMDRADAQRAEIENNLSEQLTSLREHSSKTLRSAKELAEKRMDELEQNKQVEIDKMQKEQADEIERLTTKGKSMIRESRQKAKDLKRQITEEYEVKISSLEGDLDRVKSIQKEYEKKAIAKIAKRDQQIMLLEARNRESTRANGELDDKVRKAERNSKELVCENDRLRRQLGSRFGPGGASQTQLEELTSVCKSLREENRRLKDANPDRLLLARDMPDAPSSSNNETKQTISSFSKDALTQFREEYEEKIEALEDEKRDLVMKSSAAVTETQKAEQRSWGLEEELTKVRSELTTALLACQRNERRSDFSAGLSASSKKRYEKSDHHEKENTPNSRIQGLPPSGVKRQDFTPKDVEPKPKKKNDEKSLMELTSKNNGDAAGSTPDCQQS